jgi:hypothetical protein
MNRGLTPTLIYHDTDTGEQFRYEPQPGMTGYQAGLVVKLLAIASPKNASPPSIKAVWNEIYPLTTEHWKKFSAVILPAPQ